MRHRARTVLAATVAALVITVPFAASAWAAAPSNDDYANASATETVPLKRGVALVVYVDVEGWWPLEDQLVAKIR